MSGKTKATMVLAVPIFLMSSFLIFVFSFWLYYQGRAFPKTFVAGIDVSGKSEDEISVILESETAKFLSENSDFYIGDEPIPIKDLKISFDLAKTANQATAPRSLLDFSEKNISISFNFDQSLVINLFSRNEAKNNVPVENPSFLPTKGKIVAGRAGKRLSYSASLNDFQKSLGNLKNKSKLIVVEIPPSFSSEDLAEELDLLDGAYDNGLNLIYKDFEKKVSKEEILFFVNPSDGSNVFGAVPFMGDNPLLAPLLPELSREKFSFDKIYEFLEEENFPFEREPQNAVLGYQSGKLIILKKSQNGLTVDKAETTKNIIKSLNSRKKKAEVVVVYTSATINENNLEELGIKELIASGYSNFSGSPANRRHNIKVGASKFNGLLIKPGDTFSFTANLGEVDAANGYLPELVIKENTTIPEYGGGLCQVSTTAFRAALNAGLPIVVRKAHSYPVSYYKPYGTDATIYIPNPDLKFVNDTGSYILIQTRIVGNYLYFDFYGSKKDIVVKFAGNQDAKGAVSRVELSKPYIYDFNHRGPGSFKAIFYRFIYDNKGNLLNSEYFFSNYDSPEKYPH